MERRINLDQASTSYPKAPGTGEAMSRFLETLGCNISRGGYQEAYDAGELVLQARQRLACLFGAPDPGNVVFTSGATASLNMLLKGFLRPGDRLVIGPMEHNAVTRPAAQLEKSGVALERLPADKAGRLDLDALEKALSRKTAAVVLTHASNVCGTLAPLKEAGELCRRAGAALLVDAAQTAGIFPIHMREMKISALAFPGHKGLLGPQGIGGMVLEENFARRMEPLVSGGTGSFSGEEEMPPLLPDRFEAGTLNLPGIAGLLSALDWLEKRGTDAVRRQERALTEQFLSGLGEFSGLAVPGPPPEEERAAVVSLQAGGMDEAQLGFLLETQYGIMTRCGLHCAPWAHRALGTFPRGTVRFSFGCFHTEEDVQAALEALRGILKG